MQVAHTHLHATSCNPQAPGLVNSVTMSRGDSAGQGNIWRRPAGSHLLYPGKKNVSPYYFPLARKCPQPNNQAAWRAGRDTGGPGGTRGPC